MKCHQDCSIEKENAIMSRPLKCSKFQEAGEQENIDRLSNLPIVLLAHILSFLPTKCAVGTSILSTKWRCLHMLTNSLSFECPYVLHDEKNLKAYIKGFKKFVYRVLLLHKVSPIKKFQFRCDTYTYDDSDLHAWISAALSKGVERVHLWFSGQLNALPHRLFNCQTIVELQIVSRLRGFRCPESIHLPRLKILKLGNIRFLDIYSVESFFSACPLLQELELGSSGWPMNSDRHVQFSSTKLKHLVITSCRGRLEADAPSLAYLKYWGNESGGGALALKNADRLVTADLYFPIMDNFDLVQAACALTKVVCSVKELHLSGMSAQYLTLAGDDGIPSYPNLEKFLLGTCTYETWKYITYWLANSPRLERLIFSAGFIKAATEETKWPHYVELVPFSSGVKVIEVFYFHAYTTELVPLRHLLTYAKELKKMVLYTRPGSIAKWQAFQLNKELMLLPRASSTCEVQLMDG